MSDSRDAAGPSSGRPAPRKRGRWVPGPSSIGSVARHFSGPSSIGSVARHFSAASEACKTFTAAQEALKGSISAFSMLGLVWQEDPDPATPPEALPAPAAAATSPASDADVPPADRLPSQLQPAERWQPPATTDESTPEGVALYERRDAADWFVERLRVWWPPFDPGSNHHWIRLERELAEIHRESAADPRSPEEFNRARLQWTPEDLVAYMERVRLIVDPPGARRGRPPLATAAGWTCNQWLAAMFAKHPDYRFKSDPELSELSEQSGRKFSASAIRVSKVRKAQRARDQAEAEQNARAAADDLGEDFGANGLRITTRKSGTGRQRRKKPGDQAAERADRAHDAAAEEFLANAEPKRRRPK